MLTRQRAHPIAERMGDHTLELLGGELIVRSAGRGCGSEFTVRLPQELARAAPPEQGEEIDSHAGAGRILIVENNRNAAESPRALVERFGHEAPVAVTGPAGVEAAPRLQREALLSDPVVPQHGPLCRGGGTAPGAQDRALAAYDGGSRRPYRGDGSARRYTTSGRSRASCTPRFVCWT